MASAAVSMVQSRPGAPGYPQKFYHILSLRPPGMLPSSASPASENMTDLLFPLEAGIQGRESDLSATPLKTGARRSPHCQLCFTYSPQQSRGLGKRGLCGEQSCMLQTHDTGARHCWSWSPRPFCRRRWTAVRKLRRIDETRRKVLISFSTRLHPSFRSRSDYLGKLIGWSVLGGLVPCHAL